MEWKLYTLDQSVTPSLSGHWQYPSKEEALKVARGLIDRRSLVTVLYLETTDEQQRVERADIEKWCRDQTVDE
jgi:hypothetical protein